MQTARRLDIVKEYYFSQKLREIAALEAQGHKVLNLAIGNPDLPPHSEVIGALTKSAHQDQVHGYQSYQGHPDLRKAIAGFYLKQYQVSLDPRDEILPMMGSKEGITHISLAFLNSKDKVLVPELGYPTYQSVSEMVEAEVIRYPLQSDINWEPRWDFFDQLDNGVKAIWVNYPHMPTGTAGSIEWLAKFVEIARRNDILLIHDNPYSFILNDRPTSIFNVPGAREIAIELNSLSKTFNMAGWRVGWACGRRELIEPVLRIKSNMDSGMFLPIQRAAIAALSLGQDWYDQLNVIYKQRRKKAFEFLEKLHCSFDTTQQGMFVWARVYQGTGEELVNRLLSDQHIFITPGVIFGQIGQHYVRLSLCNSEEKFDQAIEKLKQ